MFKPVKRFTKKQLKGLDKHDLAVEQIEAEEQRRKRKENSTSHKEVPVLNNGFVNWFEDEPKEKRKTLKRITLKKADGRVVGLDDYENDILW
jgi:hypothetical protein